MSFLIVFINDNLKENAASLIGLKSEQILVYVQYSSWTQLGLVPLDEIQESTQPTKHPPTTTVYTPLLPINHIWTQAAMYTHTYRGLAACWGGVTI